MRSGILLGVRLDTERNQVVREGLADWVQGHRPPPGVLMYGHRPALRFFPGGPGKPGGRVTVVRDETAHPEPFTPAEQEAVDRWYRDWSAANDRLRTRAEEV